MSSGSFSNFFLASKHHAGRRMGIIASVRRGMVANRPNRHRYRGTLRRSLDTKAAKPGDMFPGRKSLQRFPQVGSIGGVAALSPGIPNIEVRGDSQ
jgi:hypothetical protein